MEWYETVEIIEPHVVRISTPRGSGTGFLISNSKGSELCAVATAAHVVNHAHYWEEPIRIEHVSSGKSVLVRHPQRAVFRDDNRDTAGILFNRGEIPFPTEILPLAPKERYLKVGIEIGWLGFPAIPGASLCFFGGKVSAWIQAEDAYLVDGVTINGVSGGPAFFLVSTGPFIMGVVSAYVPNRATGEALPGLGVIRGVGQVHDLVQMFASLDQAKEQETPPAPPPPSPDGEGSGDVSSRRAT